MTTNDSSYGAAITEKRNLILGILAGLAAGFFWGVPFLAPQVLADFQPIDIAFGRFFFFGLISLIFARPAWAVWRALSGSDRWKVIGLSASGYWLYSSFLFLGVRLTDGVISSLIVGLLPVTVALLGSQGRKLRAAVWVGLLLITAGLVTLFGYPMLSDRSMPEVRQVHVPVLGGIENREIIEITPPSGGPPRRVILGPQFEDGPAAGAPSALSGGGGDVANDGVGTGKSSDSDAGAGSNVPAETNGNAVQSARPTEVADSDSRTHHAPAAVRTSLTGILILVIALLLWTAYAIMNTRFLQKHRKVPAKDLASLMGILSLIFMLPIWLIGSNPAGVISHPRLGLFLVFAAILGIGGSWIANWLWNLCSQRCPPHVSGPLIVSETFFGLLYSFVFVGRWPQAYETAAIGLLMLGVFVSVRSALKG